MSQIQCPNCSGYKIGTPGGGPNAGCGTVLLILGALFTLVGIVVGNSSGSPLWGGVLMLVVGIVAMVGSMRYAQTHHECSICGKKWETPD